MVLLPSFLMDQERLFTPGVGGVWPRRREKAEPERTTTLPDESQWLLSGKGEGLDQGEEPGQR